MVSLKVKIAKNGNARTSCFKVSGDSHHKTARGGRLPWGFIWVLPLLLAAACDPVTGTGPGTPPDPRQYLKVDTVTQTAVVTLIAGSPAPDYQFIYEGYGTGTLVLNSPPPCHLTLQSPNPTPVPPPPSML